MRDGCMGSSHSEAARARRVGRERLLGEAKMLHAALSCQPVGTQLVCVCVCACVFACLFVCVCVFVCVRV